MEAERNTMVAWVSFLAAVCFVFPASLLRPLGGYLSDTLGARGVMATVVGLLGALGGVLVPLLAAPLQAATGRPQMLLGVLLGLTAVSTGWFHAAGLAAVLTARPALEPEPATADVG